MDFLKVSNIDGYMIEFSKEPHSLHKHNVISIYKNEQCFLSQLVMKVRRVTPTFYDIECNKYDIMIEYCESILYVIVTENNKLIYKLYFDNIIKRGDEEIRSIMHLFRR